MRPVYKGHSNERSIYDQLMFSQNSVVSSPCAGTCDEGSPVMKGHLSCRVTCDVGSPVMKGHL